METSNSEMHDPMIFSFDSIPVCDGQTDRQTCCTSCSSIAEHGRSDIKHTYICKVPNVAGTLQLLKHMNNVVQAILNISV